MKPKQINIQELEQLKISHPEIFINDQIDLAIDELFDIAYPSKKDIKNKDEVQSYSKDLVGADKNAWGSWIYYPWLNQVVHFPPIDDLRALRTSRNRNLITSEEQAKLYASTILIIGMSVGSNIVEALVSQGIGDKLILVDMDVIEPSNLNRIRSPYHHVGLHKVDAISRKVWEIDPYIVIVGHHEGLNDQNLNQILEAHNVNVIVDEMDELRMKIILREVAKERQIAVVMAADDGDDSLLEVERYDLSPETEIFDGRIPKDVIARLKAGNIPRAELGIMIGRYFVGPEHVPLRMYESLMEVGKSLPSWPQLGGAAALSGVAITFVIKKILLGKKVKSGRTLISLDEKLDLERLDDEHEIKLHKFQKMMSGENQDV